MYCVTCKKVTLHTYITIGYWRCVGCGEAK